MRSPVTPLKPFLVEETRKAREAYAADALGLDKVRETVTKAALAGEGVVRIPLTMRVHETKAAADLEAWAKGQGFIFTWEARPLERPDAPRETVFEPEIRWIESGIR